MDTFDAFFENFLFLLCVYRAKKFKKRENVLPKKLWRKFLENFIKDGRDRVQSREARNLFPRFTVLFNSAATREKRLTQKDT